MLNPESNFMSPIRTQPSKKQRGGTTPSTMSSASRGASTLAGSAARPPNPSQAVNEGLARRRAELRRLQEKQQARSARRPEAVTTADLMLSKGVPPPTNAVESTSSSTSRGPVRTHPSAPAPGPPPPVNGAMGKAPPGGPPLRHHSDLFPTVPKSPKPQSTAVPPLAKPNAPIAIESSQMPNLSGPPPSNSSLAAGRGKPPAAPSSGNSVPRPPPPVARKLEFASGSLQDTKSRAKSAPPVRPPPPPPSSASKGLKETPSKEAPPRVQSKPPTARRPAPMSIDNLLSPAPHPNGQSRTSAPVPPRPAQPSPVGPPSTPSASPKDQSGAVTKTPAPIAPPTSFPSARRDKINLLRDGLGGDTTSSEIPKTVDEKTNGSSAKTGALEIVAHSPVAAAPEPSVMMKPVATANMEQALKQVMEEKVEALKQIAELEDKLSKAMEGADNGTAKITAPSPTLTLTQSTVPPKALQKMLQIVDRDGELAGLQWAREQVVGVPPLSNSEDINHSSNGMLFGMPGSPGPRLLDEPFGSSKGRLPLARRLAALQPKLMERQNMVQVERQLQRHFREAALCSPFEFTSDSTNRAGDGHQRATFVIRRPYGIETAAELFSIVSLTSHADYSRKAHVSTPTTLEVAVTLQTDEGSDYLLLSDSAAVRYQTSSMNNTGDGEWKHIANVDELDRPLGNATYIDNEGIERDYSLDALVEEALLVREQYCLTITSTALGFKDRPPVEIVKEVSVPAATNGTGKPETSTVAVDTADIPYPPATIEVKHDQNGAAPGHRKKDPPKEEEASSTGDILSIFVGMLFRNIFGLIWWILVGLPLAIVRTAVVGALAAALLSILYLYLRETTYNGTTYSYLSSSAYYSNSPGIF